MKKRLAKILLERGLAATRRQAENYIKLGFVYVEGEEVSKPGILIGPEAKIELKLEGKYVSRAAYKLQSVAQALQLNFKDKTVLDVGSSSGGFTDFVLAHGANKVIAVDVGTNQLHPSLRNNPRVELHEKTDIRQFKTNHPIDLILIDVSFISLRLILPSIAKLSGPKTTILAMAKPQFEAKNTGQKNRGVVKNNRERRAILKGLESWIQKLFIITAKADSEVAGAKGNVERFYLLKPLSKTKL